MLYRMRCTQCGEFLNYHVEPLPTVCERCGGALILIMVRRVEGI